MNIPGQQLSRWQRTCGGTNPQRRCSRYTKPGYRFRGLDKKRLHDILTNPGGRDKSVALDTLQPTLVWTGGTLTSSSTAVTYNYFDTSSTYSTTDSIYTGGYWTTGTSTTSTYTTNLPTDQWVYVSGNRSTAGDWTWDTVNIPSVRVDPGSWQPDPKQLTRMRFQRQLTIEERNREGEIVRAVRRSWDTDFSKVDNAEINALRLLKNMLDEATWKRYLKYGFILVQSRVAPHLRYQIFRGGGHVLVRHGRAIVAELCLSLDRSRVRTPPTDQVVALKLMAELDELRFWAEANIHSCRGMTYTDKPTAQQLRQLAA